MKVLKERWYPVDAPFGDGTFIRAGSPDCAGEFVADVEGMLGNDDLHREESVYEIVKHICDLHNASLANICIPAVDGGNVGDDK